MRRGIILILSILLALCLVQGVVAAGADFVQSEATVEPASGDLAHGDQVIVHVIVKLTGGTDTTFNTNDELEAYTELVDPKWDYTILVNSQGIPKHTTVRYVRLLGWDLAYPEESDVTVEYSLVGKVPGATQTSDLTLFRLRQIDANGNVPPGGEILIERTLINPADVDNIRNVRIKKIEELRASIDEYTALGVNVVEADKLYHQAKDKIEESKTASYSKANTLLTDAGVLIKLAEASLENAYASSLIDATQVTIDAVHSDISYFINDRKMAGNTKVAAIQNKVALAETQVSQAKDFRDNMDFYQSRLKANEAQLTANEAQSMSTELRNSGLGGLPDISGMGTYIIIIVAVIIVAGIGFVLYRRVTKWDELG